MKKVYLVVFVILALSLAYQSYQVSNKQKKLNTVTLELEKVKNAKPTEIIVHDTKIEYKYKDGKTITKYRVPEGYVKFDLSAYDATVTKLDSLEAIKQGITEKLNNALQASVMDKVSIGKYKESLKKLEASIASLQQQLTPEKPSYITVRNRGFCFRPQIGIGYNGEFTPYVGVKGAYLGYYGFGVGTTRDQFGIAITRKIYDIIPFTKNTEIMFMGGMPYKTGEGNIFVGLGVNL